MKKKIYSLSRVLSLALLLSLIYPSHDVCADEFTQALDRAIQSVKFHKEHFANLIDELDENNQELWGRSHQGFFPALSSRAYWSNPSLAMLRAQQSLIFWDAVEFQLEQFRRFYSKLPEGAFQTQPIQTLIFEVIAELNHSAALSFDEVFHGLHVLRQSYVLSRQSLGLPRDEVITQDRLDQVMDHLDSRFGQMEESRVEFYWEVARSHLFRYLMVDLPSFLFSEQLHFDFLTSLDLARVFLPFFKGDSAHVFNLDQDEQRDSRWVNVISNYFENSDRFFNIQALSLQRQLRAGEVLFSEVDSSILRDRLRKSILMKSLNMTFTKEEVIMKDWAEKKKQLSNSEAKAPCSGKSSSRKSRARRARARVARHVDPSLGAFSVEPNIEGEILEAKHLLNDSMKQEIAQGAAAEVDETSPMSFSNGAQACDEEVLSGQEVVAMPECIALDQRGSYSPLGQESLEVDSLTERFHALRGGAEFSTLDEYEQVPDERDYLGEARAHHDYFQRFKKVQGRPVDPGVEAKGSSSLNEIELKGRAAQTYQVIMGIGDSAISMIRNRDVNELVTALGGGITQGKGVDIKYWIPNRSQNATQSQIFFRLHTRHGGAETFPLRTLRTHVRGAIERAGLESFVRLN